MDNTEDRLARNQAEYQSAPLPTQLDYAVRSGVRRAALHRKKRIRIAVGTACACLLLLFFGSIRVSPVFASYVKQIPGMEGIVALIAHDKGLQLAAEHDLIQPVNITDTHGGNSLTVNGVIVDESRVVIFYSLVGENSLDQHFNDLKLLDEHGKNIPASYEYGNLPEDHNKLHLIDINMQEGTPLPKEITVSYSSSIKPSLGELKVTLPLDTTKTAGMKKMIPLNQDLVVDGQRIHLKQATLSPTRLTLEVAFADRNTKRIFGLKDLKLIDEQGREWVTRSASITSDNSQSIYFESMYFSSPKQLTLKGAGISALEKDQIEVVVDLDQGKLLKAPKGLSFTGSHFELDNRVINFQLEGSDLFLTNLLFDQVTNDSGDKFDIVGSSSRMGGDDTDHIEISFTIEDGAKTSGKLKMRISNYPIQSGEPFELKLPLPADSER